MSLFDIEVSVVCPSPWQDRMKVWTFFRSYHEVDGDTVRQYLFEQHQRAARANPTPQHVEYYFNWNIQTEDNP